MPRTEPIPPTGAVEATLQYLAPHSPLNRRFVAPGAELNTGIYESCRVRIGNARPLRAKFSLDGQGFTLCRHASTVEDFSDREQIDARYPAEIIGLIQTLTGATRVAPWGWMIRSAGPIAPSAAPAANYTHQSGVQPPASEVHVDMTPDRAERLAQTLYRTIAPQGPGYQRFIATSCWRAFSAPPQDWPLALCDGTTVADDEGVPNTMVIVDALPSASAMRAALPDEAALPAASVFRFNPAHRWWYFPDLVREEVIVLKFFDSDRRVAWRTPHTSFHDTTYPKARVRQSIEFRTIAYFE